MINMLDDKLASLSDWLQYTPEQLFNQTCLHCNLHINNNFCVYNNLVDHALQCTPFHPLVTHALHLPPPPSSLFSFKATVSSTIFLFSWLLQSDKLTLLEEIIINLWQSQNYVLKTIWNCYFIFLAFRYKFYDSLCSSLTCVLFICTPFYLAYNNIYFGVCSGLTYAYMPFHTGYL